VTGLRVQVEAALDFAPHGIELISRQEFLDRCRALRREARREADKGRGEIATEAGIQVVLCGPPNAGKSSLLNRLVGEEKVIVHEVAGTTRDAVAADVEVDGVHFRLTDTAGLGDETTGPTARAMQQARDRVASCHLVLLVLDGSAALPDEALEPARSVPPSRLLCVINKSDLPPAWEAGLIEQRGLKCENVRTSALTGEGLDELRVALWRTVAEGRLDASAADCLFNARQREALRRAMAEIESAQEAVKEGLGYEFAALNLREATAALGEVTGQVTSQDLLDHIFSRFCIGK
jgi:tRNA modification GTPase